jgi:hypothetical protein
MRWRRGCVCRGRGYRSGDETVDVDFGFGGDCFVGGFLLEDHS